MSQRKKIRKGRKKKVKMETGTQDVEAETDRRINNEE